MKEPTKTKKKKKEKEKKEKEKQSKHLYISLYTVFQNIRDSFTFEFTTNSSVISWLVNESVFIFFFSSIE